MGNVKVDIQEVMANLFEPDVVLPGQFTSVDGKGLKGGERRLMAALLSDGIESYIHQHSSNFPPPQGFDASEWIETCDYAYVFSFDNVCEGLGIDPEYLRLGLARYVQALTTSEKKGEAKTIWKKIRRPRK